MRRDPALVILLAALTTALGPGCSSYRPPGVVVGAARLVEATDDAVRLDVDLALANPNREPVALRDLTYTLSIDGRTVYEGRRSAQVTLAAGDERRLPLPAVVRRDRIGGGDPASPSGARWSLRGRLVYVTPGALTEILLDSRIRTPTVTFAGEGTVDLPRVLHDADR